MISVQFWENYLDNNGIFKKARDLISENLIIKLFSTKGALRRNHNWVCLSPLRQDNNIGSFSINLNNGTYKDFATNEDGSFFDLISKSNGITLIEAAKKIISESGGVVIENTESNSSNSKKEKPDAILPVPDNKVKILKDRLETKWSIQRFGEVQKNSGWTHYNENNERCFIVVRHLKEDKKTGKTNKSDIPYYFTVEDKWSQGYPPVLLKSKKLPLFNIEQLSDLSVIIILVEGQKCASIKISKEYLLITWAGGSNGMVNTDWTPLQKTKNPIIQWPDSDLQMDKDRILLPEVMQPGLKACLEIQEKYLPKSKILKIKNIENIPGWDIFDAFSDGINIPEYIKNCSFYSKKQLNEETKAFKPKKKDPPKQSQGLSFHPFKILGYTEKIHYFLPDSAPIPMGIPRGSFSKGHMNELAPFSFWVDHFGNESGQKVKEDLAKDWLINSSHRKGYYNPEIIRGAGVWRDKDRIIVNNGNKIITHDGEVSTYQDFDTKYIYILSDAKMGDFKGSLSTFEEGKLLIELFKAQNFSNSLGYYAVLGWCLIAPFCSFLKWRPPIWVSGPSKVGKSYLIDNLMLPLVGDFCYNGSGRDSESAIRRSIGQNGQPAIIDETEPRTPEARKRLNAQIDLVRNGTSDSSSKISLSNMTGGVDSFRIRSCFAFSSIIPYLDGSAIESRFTVCRLQGMDKDQFQEKKESTIRIINTGAFNDPEKFRRRIFKLLPVIEKNIEYLVEYIFQKVGDKRTADNLSPFFASIFALENDGLITESEPILDEIIKVINEAKEHQEADEDLLFREILSIIIREDGETFTVGQLIWSCYDDEKKRTRHGLLLEKYGIKVRVKEFELAISKNNRELRRFLQDTFYAAKYGEILTRHPAVEHPGKTVRISEAGEWSVCFSLTKIINTYFSEEQDKDENQGQNLSNEENKIEENTFDQDNPFDRD